MKHTLILFGLLALSSCAWLAKPHDAQAWDTTVPDYGSSAHERRMEQGKYFEGSPQYPYSNRESNVQRDNRELREREQREEQARRESAERQRHEAARDLYKPRW